MKKIFLLFILSSIGTSALGYTWSVTNESNQPLDVQVCVTLGSNNCQKVVIAPQQKNDFSFTETLNKGLVLHSVTIQRPDDATTKQSFGNLALTNKLGWQIPFGGSFSINDHPSEGYVLSTSAQS